jgi:subtilisin family serine protease
MRTRSQLVLVHAFFTFLAISANPTFASNRPQESLNDLKQMNEVELNELFDLKDAKGESVFRNLFKRRRPEEGMWSTLDPIKNKTEGTSTERVYQDYRISKRKNPVIVAVIDSGVDIHHEDLRGKIWVNEKELNGKPGVDDDGDGYVDDLYGWNFLGNPNGKNVADSNLEVTRVYADLKKRAATGVLSMDEAELLHQVSSEVEAGIAKAQKGLIRYESFKDAIELLRQSGLKEESVSGLDAVTSTLPEVLTAKDLARIVFSNGLKSVDVLAGIDYFNNQLKVGYNPDFNTSDLVGDHPEDMNEKGYGNNDVTGPDARHGTHVAGIIAANRDNRYGIDGQGRNIKIMSIRAVPNGDERDKDVANAIRFAVDHGAKVINMSFGKPYSPGKSTVDEAVKYAESKGVLLVHAAGNDGKNTESQFNNFPNRRVHDENGISKSIETWIEVGASGKEKGLNLPAKFSNYGQTSVDIFAPGVNIVSTIPGNQYASLNGTSMASPEVAGVAALLLEKVPTASASQLKEAILKTSNFYYGLNCMRPGSKATDEPVLFSTLSSTGGTVNAYEAMRWLVGH